MRRLAKNINFGIIYGISPYGLAKQIGTAVNQAKDYIDQYFSRYPKVKQYLDDSVRSAQELGYAKTLIGRRRYIPELKSTDRTARGFAERAAINTPIQGSAADVINTAMINIHTELKTGFQSKMILQVHDELLFEVYKDEVSAFTEIVKNNMEGAWKLKVPLVVDISIGNSWAEAH